VADSHERLTKQLPGGHGDKSQLALMIHCHGSWAGCQEPGQIAHESLQKLTPCRVLGVEAVEPKEVAAAAVLMVLGLVRAQVYLIRVTLARVAAAVVEIVTAVELGTEEADTVVALHEVGYYFHFSRAPAILME
jgi:hypothetical protein